MVTKENSRQMLQERIGRNFPAGNHSRQILNIFQCNKRKGNIREFNSLQRFSTWLENGIKFLIKSGIPRDRAKSFPPGWGGRKMAGNREKNMLEVSSFICETVSLRAPEDLPFCLIPEHPRFSRRIKSGPIWRAYSATSSRQSSILAALNFPNPNASRDEFLTLHLPHRSREYNKPRYVAI